MQTARLSCQPYVGLRLRVGMVDIRWLQVWSDVNQSQLQGFEVLKRRKPCAAPGGIADTILERREPIAAPGIDSLTWRGPVAASDTTTDATAGCIQEAYDMEQLLAASIGVAKVRVATVSAATDNVIGPGRLPEDAVFIPNATVKHFGGASDARIEKYGQVGTMIKSSESQVSCAWQVSDVNRALHSVAKACGPKGVGNGKQGVLLDNDICVVVPPGVVKEIYKRLTPVMQYEREGNLYVAGLEMSSFHRQCRHASALWNRAMQATFKT